MLYFCACRTCSTIILRYFLFFDNQNIVPLLKYVRGEALSPDHWLELFRLLKMPKGTILEKLTFGDVLQSADQIIAHADALKVGFNFLGSLVDVT